MAQPTLADPQDVSSRQLRGGVQAALAGLAGTGIAVRVRAAAPARILVEVTQRSLELRVMPLADLVRARVRILGVYVMPVDQA
jgi:hypothetical protein